MLRTIGNVLIFASALPALASVAVYARVPWWRTMTGRHLMSYMSVIAAVLTLSCLRILIGDSPEFVVIRLAVFAGVPLVMWSQLVLLLRAQRGGRRET